MFNLQLKNKLKNKLNKINYFIDKKNELICFITSIKKSIENKTFGKIIDKNYLLKE